MKPVIYQEASGTKGYWSTLAIFGLLILLGMAAFFYTEHFGHYVTGMNNQVVWGVPHVFAIFLIVAASGALNIASIASVFNQSAYKPLARISGVLALCLLAGGLAVLVLDLGRPERLIVAMTEYNFKSIFTWNIYFYNGFFIIVGAYLWTMMESKANKFTKNAGTFAFIWRLILTTGTGSIFAFIVARQTFNAAIITPIFIALSLSLGLAIFLLLLISIYHANGKIINQELLTRTRNLLGIFVGLVLFLVVIYNLTNLYASEHHAVQNFILFSGSRYTIIFWLGQILIGAVLPLILIFANLFDRSIKSLVTAIIMIIIGGWCQLYVLIVGGQAYPLVLFPNGEVSSSFDDGVVAGYDPSLAEILLGLGGVGIAIGGFLFISKILPILPINLANSSD